MTGITASYTITSSKKIKEWRLSYYPINKDGDAISIGGSNGQQYKKFSIVGSTGPYRPRQKYDWVNRTLTDSYKGLRYIPYQLEILYADNTVETIKIRKDNFNQYFPNRKWIDTDILDLSLDDQTHYSTTPVTMNNKNNERNSAQIVTPDVDVNIPDLKLNNPNTFAVIIANENYQEEAKVDFAIKDGEIFKEYCHKVLGLPEKNIHLRKDATKNNIIAELSWMKQVAGAYKGKAKFIVYYSGHGIPNEQSKAAYLLPVDGMGTNTETAYSLQEFYKKLSSMQADRITVFMDACFSGSQRGDGMLASARGVAIKYRSQVPIGKMVVFSAAQGDETAYPYKEKGHGMFTYFLLKKLKESNGDCTYNELADYIKTNVNQQSIVTNRKSQTPEVKASANVVNTWKTMKLK